VTDRLIDNVERARENDDGSVINRGLELLGKEQGMFVDRQMVGGPAEFAELDSLSSDELRERMRRYIREIPGVREFLYECFAEEANDVTPAGTLSELPAPDQASRIPNRRGLA
jgi:hypothetical protein